MSIQHNKQPSRSFSIHAGESAAKEDLTYRSSNLKVLEKVAPLSSDRPSWRRGVELHDKHSDDLSLATLNEMVNLSACSLIVVSIG